MGKVTGLLFIWSWITSLCRFFTSFKILFESWKAFAKETYGGFEMVDVENVTYFVSLCGTVTELRFWSSDFCVITSRFVV